MGTYRLRSRLRHQAVNFVLALLSASLLCSNASAIPVGEVESNDFNSSANPLYPGQSGRGTILSGPEFDAWVIPQVKPSDFYCFLLSAITDSGDPVMSIFYSGNLISNPTPDVYNDDGGPPSVAFRDSMVCGEIVPHAGSIFVKVDGFGSSTLNPYELFQTVISPNEVSPEIEPNDSPDTATPVTAAAMSGQGSTSDADYYSFYANLGERIVIMVDRDPGRPSPASSFNSLLTVFDSDGTTDLTSLVPGTFLGNGNSFGAMPAPHDGTYYVRVTKIDGEDGDYRLVVLVEGDSPLSGACCEGTPCRLLSKANCRGFFAGVGTECAGDNDGDGILNDCDNCPAIGNFSQEDNDADFVGNACEECVDDPTKLSAGQCGCGTSDTDSDQDGSADCNDQCQFDPAKTLPGVCGCNIADADLNANGVLDCQAGAEARSFLEQTLAELKKFRALPKGAKNSAKKARAKKIARIRLALTQLQQTVQTAGAQIAVNQPGFNLGQAVSDFASLVNRTLKARAAALNKNKKKALARGQGIVAAIA